MVSLWSRLSGKNPLPMISQLLRERLLPVEILDALADTEHWLNWTQFFGPLSGLDAKLKRARERYLLTVFCYGCNLGPAQTARSVRGIDRFKLAFINLAASCNTLHLIASKGVLDVLHAFQGEIRVSTANRSDETHHALLSRLLWEIRTDLKIPRTSIIDEFDARLWCSGTAKPPAMKA
jgi:hypothetical protein